MQNIRHDLEKIKMVALHCAKEHKCNYNIILLNPDKDGNFDPKISTYEYVTDSYFDKPRENVIILFHTDELLSEENNELYDAVFPRNPKFMNFAITNHHNNIDKWLPTNPPQYRRETPKIGRNNICTCGSGKKFKNCCLLVIA